jgi:DNA-binding NtrC family response regulator
LFWGSIDRIQPEYSRNKGIWTSAKRSSLRNRPETLPEHWSFLQQNMGFELLKADNLKDVLLTLQENRIDSLVLDAALLEEDCGFISVIKGMERNLPIIVCAEKNTPELESEIRKYQIFYYHIKSFGIEDLVMAIANAVNGLSH